MLRGERSAEAVRRCVNERAALQSWAWVLTGLLPEQPRQLKHGWTQDVIETPLARTSWRRHRALRGHPRDLLLSGVQAHRGRAGHARQGLRKQEQSGEPVTTGAEARVPGVFGGDGAQDLDHLQGSLRGSGARYGGLPQDCVWIDEDKT